MALRFSTGCVNAIASGFGWRAALRDGRLYIYTGTQPANADTAPSGTQLVVFTVSGGEYTAPVKAQAKITLTGSSGSVGTITVGGSAFNLLSAAVDFSTDLTSTAAAVAANINARQNPLNITATSSAADVLLHAPYWLGALANGLTLAATATTLGASINGGTSTKFGGTGAPAAGVSAVNGLNLLYPASAGVLTKDASVWQGLATAGGTAGWFRFVAGGSAAAGASTTDVRFDGSIATSGADINVASTTIVDGAVQTVPTFTFTVPTTAA